MSKRSGNLNRKSGEFVGWAMSQPKDDLRVVMCHLVWKMPDGRLVAACDRRRTLAETPHTDTDICRMCKVCRRIDLFKNLTRRQKTKALQRADDWIEGVVEDGHSEETYQEI